jgi:hypothetical protein
VDCPASTYALQLDDHTIIQGLAFSESANDVERIEFRTGPATVADWTRFALHPVYPDQDLPGADEPVADAVFDLGRLRTIRVQGPVQAPRLIAGIDAVSTGRAYRSAPVRPGIPIYIDRSYALGALPVQVKTCDIIQTANEDDAVAAHPHLSFTLAGPATVHLAFHDGATALPAWATGFQATDHRLTVPGAGVFRLHRQDFPAGRVLLGGNERGATRASSMYFVLVAPAADATP